MTAPRTDRPAETENVGFKNIQMERSRIQKELSNKFKNFTFEFKATTDYKGVNRLQVFILSSDVDLFSTCHLPTPHTFKLKKNFISEYQIGFFNGYESIPEIVEIDEIIRKNLRGKNGSYNFRYFLLAGKFGSGVKQNDEKKWEMKK